MKKNILLSIALAATTALYAQKDSLNAVIQVENDYNPVVTKAVKKGFTPTTEQSNAGTPTVLEFSKKATPFRGFVGENNIEELLPQQDKNYPGYARLGYGTGNNIDAKASYLFDLGERDKINAIASLEGFNDNIDGPTGKWNSRMYSSWAGLDYSHKFDKLISRSIVEYSSNVFNYNTLQPSDKQNVQKINVGTGISSTLAGPFAYEFGVRYSRNHYKHRPFLWDFDTQHTGYMGENKFGTDAAFKYEFTDRNIYNLITNISFDYYSYYKMSGYKNFAEINVNPATNFKAGIFNIRLGAKLNMITRGRAFLAAAPDIYAEGGISKSTSLYISATGGRKATNLETLEALSPYWACNRQLKPAYTVADITTGVRISQDALSLNIYLGYAYTKDDLLAWGVYSHDQEGISSQIAQKNTIHTYIGAQAGYDCKGWFKGSVATRYNYWKCDTYALLGTKPEFELDLNGEARVLDDLYFNLTYSFATYAHDTPSLNKNELNLRANYKFADRFNVFVEGSNLLNRNYIKYAGYYEQGINVLMGWSASF